MTLNRRSFIKQSAVVGAEVTMAGKLALSFPTLITKPRGLAQTGRGQLTFRPFFPETLGEQTFLAGAYASDDNSDAFHSNIKISPADGVIISDAGGRNKFGINVRWNVEGFGFLYMTADNGGEFYQLPPDGKTIILNLNFELARSRVLRNRRRVASFSKAGWKPGRESLSFIDLSEGFLADAERARGTQSKCAQLSQKALLYALWAGEKIELEHAQYDIAVSGYRRDFFTGCDARGYFQMDPELFLSRFAELFNYATITHYLTTVGLQDFEPEEDHKQFNLRSILLKELRDRKITVEGRPLFYFYKTTTPDWLKKKSYPELLKYVEKHTREVVGHYGDQMYAWEVANEMHDWANELQLNPDQLVEVVRLACQVARDTNPKVLRLLNNCCLFAEYVQSSKWTDLDAKYPQRTPHQFIKQLIEAGVDFDITGVQMYFPSRDLSDTFQLIERFNSFGKRMQITEVGASSGPSDVSVKSGALGITNDPYTWHRPWDEELQADWLESIYTFAYSKPYIEAINWYDFVDPHSFIKNGGLLRSTRGEKKNAFDRIKILQERWKNLPPHK